MHAELLMKNKLLYADINCGLRVHPTNDTDGIFTSILDLREKLEKLENLERYTMP